tara:strand:- start:200 stop:388 length:189 start_codon:yes stop_codon:yes gene_type:complete
MNIDTELPHPPAIEQVIDLIKEISEDVSDIKVDLLFIKSKLKEMNGEVKEVKVSPLHHWWWT